MKDFSGNRLCEHPVGSIIGFTNDVNPNTYYPDTKWEQIKDRFLLASGSQYSLGQTGGEATHTLTVREMPSHQHRIWTKAANSGTGNYYSYVTEIVKGIYYGTEKGQNQVEATGSGQPHNNMPPYEVVNYWKRTA